MRKRNTTLSLRISESEKCLLTRRAAQRSQSLTDYVIGTVLNEDGDRKAECRKIMTLLKQVSDRLDAIAVQLGRHDEAYFKLQDIKDMQKEIIQNIMTYSAKQQ